MNHAFSVGAVVTTKRNHHGSFPYSHDAPPRDAATTGNEFSLTAGQWLFNLDTKATGMTKGIWQLGAMLSDGSQHVVWVQLK